MVLNSLEFLLFFFAICLIYYSILKNNKKAQNAWLLVASYAFYGIVEWKMIPLLFVSTLIIFLLGKTIHKSKGTKKSTILTNLGVVSSIGLLIYFKYFNFFIESFSMFFNSIGLKSNIGTFNIIMPLGISFFTFKLISYIVDIYREKIEPAQNFVQFATFISFFPTILSGPIDKPNVFLPQLESKRSFNLELITAGFKQILWGLFLKMVIADNLAVSVNAAWGDIESQNGIVLFFVAILYSIQLYTDFSGYSDMAIGVSKVLGFKVARNFNKPFFARNVAEYWRNWHMSLTSWLTDYVFMPLNIKFRNLENKGIILAIIINMITVGMWHGANWTFALFGLYHGLLFIPLIQSGAFFKRKKLKPNERGLPTFKDFRKMISTFLLVTLGLLIFRAQNISQAFDYFCQIFNVSTYSSIKLEGLGLKSSFPAMIFAMVVIVAEWKTRKLEFGLANFGVKWKSPLRYLVYYLMILLILWFGGGEQQFLYTQF